MATDKLFKDTAIDPVALSGVNHVDTDVSGKRMIRIQFDPLTNSTYRLYFRLDETAAAGGTTLATFKPEGFLTAGGDEELWIDPSSGTTPYLHLLLTDSSGSAQSGGASDRVDLLPYRHNP